MIRPNRASHSPQRENFRFGGPAAESMSLLSLLRRLVVVTRSGASTMTTLHGVLAIVLATNGLWMLSDPGGWYGAVPGVRGTGAFNAHFVRDIGAAYLVAGLGFGALQRLGETMKPAAWTGCGFLLLHAGIHLLETLVGVHPPTDFLRDSPALLGLPLLALWSLRPFRARRQSDARPC